MIKKNNLAMFVIVFVLLVYCRTIDALSIKECENVYIPDNAHAVFVNNQILYHFDNTLVFYNFMCKTYILLQFDHVVVSYRFSKDMDLLEVELDKQDGTYTKKIISLHSGILRDDIKKIQEYSYDICPLYFISSPDNNMETATLGEDTLLAREKGTNIVARISFCKPIFDFEYVAHEQGTIKVSLHDGEPAHWKPNFSKGIAQSNLKTKKSQIITREKSVSGRYEAYLTQDKCLVLFDLLKNKEITHDALKIVVTRPIAKMSFVKIDNIEYLFVHFLDDKKVFCFDMFDRKIVSIEKWVESKARLGMKEGEYVGVVMNHGRKVALIDANAKQNCYSLCNSQAHEVKHANFLAVPDMQASYFVFGLKHSDAQCFDIGKKRIVDKKKFCVSRCGNYIAFLQEDKRVRIYDRKSEKLVYFPQEKVCNIFACGFEHATVSCFVIFFEDQSSPIVLDTIAQNIYRIKKTKCDRGRRYFAYLLDNNMLLFFDAAHKEKSLFFSNVTCFNFFTSKKNVKGGKKGIYLVAERKSDRMIVFDMVRKKRFFGQKSQCSGGYFTVQFKQRFLMLFDVSKGLLIDLFKNVDSSHIVKWQSAKGSEKYYMFLSNYKINIADGTKSKSVRDFVCIDLDSASDDKKILFCLKNVYRCQIGERYVAIGVIYPGRKYTCIKVYDLKKKKEILTFSSEWVFGFTFKLVKNSTLYEPGLYLKAYAKSISFFEKKEGRIFRIENMPTCYNSNLQSRVLDDKDQEAFRLKYKRNALDYKASGFKVFSDKERMFSFLIKLQGVELAPSERSYYRKRERPFDIVDERPMKKRKLHEDWQENFAYNWGNAGNWGKKGVH